MVTRRKGFPHPTRPAWGVRVDDGRDVLFFANELDLETAMLLACEARRQRPELGIWLRDTMGKLHDADAFMADWIGDAEKVNANAEDNSGTGRALP